MSIINNNRDKEEIDNKYYVPEIEEFHVGFEYEYNNRNPWEKKIFSPYDSMIKTHGVWYIESLIQKEQVRIKYLDKQDIESLGWKVEQKPLGSWNEGEYYVDNKEGSTVFDFHNIDPSEPTIVFNGVTFFIKNKSELKKLMMQLNITE